MAFTVGAEYMWAMLMLYSDRKEVDGALTTDGSMFCSPPLKRPKMVPPLNERVMLYVRQDAEEVYTPLHVAPPTTTGLLNAVSYLFSNIGHLRIINILINLKVTPSQLTTNPSFAYFSQYNLLYSSINSWKLEFIYVVGPQTLRYCGGISDPSSRQLLTSFF